MVEISMKNGIQTGLLQWFGKSARDLPWRKTRDPYAIWVSEIMLQQTQVATVIPYYKKFLKAHPTVSHLARANLAKVLKAWEGLGYYSRARNLHAAARIVLNHFRGSVPDTLKDLLGLPGIGRYTAGAILSIAYNKEAPILDGNVKRVLARLFAISGDTRKKKTEGTLWTLSECLIPEGHAGSFNQALMELGAMICTPRDPLCLRCPLRSLCRARAEGRPEGYPSRTVKRKIPEVKALCAVIQKNGKVLLRQRPPKGLLGGLWEFPNRRVNGREGLSEGLVQFAKDELGLSVKVKKPLVSFQQTFSHFKLTLHIYQCQSSGPDKNGEGKWVAVKTLDELAMPRIHRRIAQLLERR